MALFEYTRDLANLVIKENIWCDLIILRKPHFEEGRPIKASVSQFSLPNMSMSDLDDVDAKISNHIFNYRVFIHTNDNCVKNISSRRIPVVCYTCYDLIIDKAYCNQFIGSIDIRQMEDMRQMSKEYDYLISAGAKESKRFTYIERFDLNPGCAFDVNSQKFISLGIYNFSSGALVEIARQSLIDDFKAFLMYGKSPKEPYPDINWFEKRLELYKIALPQAMKAFAFDENEYSRAPHQRYTDIVEYAYRLAIESEILLRQGIEIDEFKIPIDTSNKL